jgi:uncharacterized paraquat-inducible protein A
MIMEKDCPNCKFELYEADEIPCKDCGMDDREYWQPKPQTNADRIRVMSDEELAKEFAMLAGWDRSEYEKAKRIGIEKVMLDWLKQPAETHTENADRCVCCGEIIPEGRQVCPNCLAAVNERKDNG